MDATKTTLRWNKPEYRKINVGRADVDSRRVTELVTSQCGRVRIQRVNSSDFGVWIDGVRVRGTQTLDGRKFNGAYVCGVRRAQALAVSLIEKV